MQPSASRFPETAWFDRHRGKIAGFAFGMALLLVLAGLLSVLHGGGLSDVVVNQPSPYVLF